MQIFCASLCCVALVRYESASWVMAVHAAFTVGKRVACAICVRCRGFVGVEVKLSDGYYVIYFMRLDADFFAPDKCISIFVSIVMHLKY